MEKEVTAAKKSGGRTVLLSIICGILALVSGALLVLHFLSPDNSAVKSRVNAITLQSTLFADNNGFSASLGGEYSITAFVSAENGADLSVRWEGGAENISVIDGYPKKVATDMYAAAYEYRFVTNAETEGQTVTLSVTSLSDSVVSNSVSFSVKEEAAVNVRLLGAKLAGGQSVSAESDEIVVPYYDGKTDNTVALNIAQDGRSNEHGQSALVTATEAGDAGKKKNDLQVSVDGTCAELFSADDGAVVLKVVGTGEATVTVCANKYNSYDEVYYTFTIIALDGDAYLQSKDVITGFYIVSDWSGEIEPDWTTATDSIKLYYPMAGAFDLGAVVAVKPFSRQDNFLQTARVEVSDPSVVKVERTASHGILLYAEKPGRCRLTLTDETESGAGASRTVEVTVYAALTGFDITYGGESVAGKTVEVKAGEEVQLTLLYTFAVSDNVSLNYAELGILAAKTDGDSVVTFLGDSGDGAVKITAISSSGNTVMAKLIMTAGQVSGTGSYTITPMAFGGTENAARIGFAVSAPYVPPTKKPELNLTKSELFLSMTDGAERGGEKLGKSALLSSLIEVENAGEYSVVFERAGAAGVIDEEALSGGKITATGGGKVQVLITLTAENGDILTKTLAVTVYSGLAISGADFITAGEQNTLYTLFDEVGEVDVSWTYSGAAAELVAKGQAVSVSVGLSAGGMLRLRADYIFTDGIYAGIKDCAEKQIEVLGVGAIGDLSVISGKSLELQLTKNGAAIDAGDTIALVADEEIFSVDGQTLTANKNANINGSGKILKSTVSVTVTDSAGRVYRGELTVTVSAVALPELETTAYAEDGEQYSGEINLTAGESFFVKVAAKNEGEDYLAPEGFYEIGRVSLSLSSPVAAIVDGQAQAQFTALMAAEKVTVTVYAEVFGKAYFVGTFLVTIVEDEVAPIVLSASVSADKTQVLVDSETLWQDIKFHSDNVNILVDADGRLTYIYTPKNQSATITVTATCADSDSPFLGHSYVTTVLVEVTAARLSADTANVKTEYIAGEPLDLSGIIITLTIGETETDLPLSDCMVVSDSLSTSGQKMVTITHRVYTALSVSFTVDCYYFSVTFSGDGGALVSGKETFNISYGESVQTPPVYSREGYSFIGWDTDFSTINEDLDITALWAKNPVLGLSLSDAGDYLAAEVYNLTAGTGVCYTFNILSGAPYVELGEFDGEKASYKKLPTTVSTDIVISMTAEILDGIFAGQKLTELFTDRALALSEPTLSAIFNADKTSVTIEDSENWTDIKFHSDSANILVDANGKTTYIYTDKTQSAKITVTATCADEASPHFGRTYITIVTATVAAAEMIANFEDAKLEYIAGETLDLTGIVLAIIIGEERLYPTVSDCIVTYDSLSTAGQKTVTLTHKIYTALSVSFTVDCYYRVSFTIGDAVGDAPAAIVAKNGTITLPGADGADKENHSFAGWNCAGTSYGAGDPFTPTANAVFTAVWMMDSFTVTFSGGGGTLVSGKETFTVLYGASVQTPPVYSRDGHTFAGWDKDFSAITERTAVAALWAENPTFSAGLYGGRIVPAFSVAPYGAERIEYTAKVVAGASATVGEYSSGGFELFAEAGIGAYTVAVEIRAVVIGGAFDGRTYFSVYTEFIPALTAPAFSVEVDPNDEGRLIVNYSGTGYDSLTLAYSVIAGTGFVQIGELEDGCVDYKTVSSAVDKEITINFTLTVNGGTFDGQEYTYLFRDLSIAETAPELKAFVLGDKSGFAVESSPLWNVISVSSSDPALSASLSGGLYHSPVATEKTVTVTVYALYIKEGSAHDGRNFSSAFSVVMEAAPTLLDAGENLEIIGNEIVYTGEKFTIVGYQFDDENIKIADGKIYIVTLPAVQKSIEITVKAKIKGGVYDGHPTEKTLTFYITEQMLADAPVLFLTADNEIDPTAFTVSSGFTSAVFTSDNICLSVNADGETLLNPGKEDKTVTVTVTAVYGGDGIYSGMKATASVTVTVKKDAYFNERPLLSAEFTGSDDCANPTGISVGDGFTFVTVKEFASDCVRVSGSSVTCTPATAAASVELTVIARYNVDGHYKDMLFETTISFDLSFIGSLAVEGQNTVFARGEEFSVGDAVLYACYIRADGGEVVAKRQIGAEGEDYPAYSSISTAACGAKTVTVTHGKYGSCQYTVYVVDLEVSPLKQYYLYSDSDFVEFSDFAVSAVLPDGTKTPDSADVTVKNGSGEEILGKRAATAFSGEGEMSVTFSYLYLGKTLTKTVTVYVGFALKVTDLTKTTYECGEAFDTDGATVNLIKENGETITAIPGDKYTVEGMNGIGDSVKVTAKITANALLCGTFSLELTTRLVATSRVLMYHDGEAFDFALEIDGNAVDNFAVVEQASFLTGAAGEHIIKVSANYEGRTHFAFVTVVRAGVVIIPQKTFVVGDTPEASDFSIIVHSLKKSGEGILSAESKQYRDLSDYLGIGIFYATFPEIITADDCNITVIFDYDAYWKRTSEDDAPVLTLSATISLLA